MSKIYSREEILKFIGPLESRSKVVGYTSGVFDILHPGHVEYLEKAKAACDLLVVGVNSDSSVKQNKGDKRPISTATDRALVVAGLSAVDYVFVFDELNNNENIKLLKPNKYIKAGDYDASKPSSKPLSSKPIIEAYGGTVEIISLKGAHSTSSIIDKIVGKYTADSISLEKTKEKSPALFLDRDGTIVKEVEYLHEPAKVEILPGVIEGIKKFQDKGYKIVVITNQAGIGLGYFSKEDFYAVNAAIFKLVSKGGVVIDKVYFCPHSKSENCQCRKPGQALFNRAVEELNIDPSNSIMVGDMTGDIQFGKNCGIKTALVTTGKCGKDKTFDVTPDFTVGSLDHLATKTLGQV